MIRKVFRYAMGFLLIVVMLAPAISAYAINFNAEATYSSIFVITSGNSLGSGFSIGPNCIITNAHVISDENNVSVTTFNGEQYQAFVVAISSELDIAVLSVDSVSFETLSIGNLDDMNIGDDVYAIGAPNSMAYTLTKGCLSAKKRKYGSHTYIQTDAAINTGNSGGPLLNNDGKVIGVNSYKVSDAEGIGLAIPISTVISFLHDCNIETNTNGNVTEIIEVNSDNPWEESNIATTEPQTSDSGMSTAFIILIIGLVCSVAFNIVLIILLIYQKKKNINLAYNPKERTDFEIDILE